MNHPRSLANCSRHAIMLMAIAACVVAAKAQSPLRINEIYFTGSFAGNAIQANDQFVEIYNASDSSPAYLDGMLIIALGGQGRPTNLSLTSQAMRAFKFPGVPGGRRIPVAPHAFVVCARNAQDFRSQGGLNLSGADWEFYAGNPFVPIDSDNAAPNLIPVGVTLIALDFSMSATGDAILLCDGTDTTISDGIAMSSIVDAVEYHAAASNTKLLPTILDQGAAGANVIRGVGVERRTPGFDTDNSTVDFDTAAPSPGRQHGSVVSSGLQPDIYPLALWTSKLFDEYTVDSLGTRIDSTRHDYTTQVVMTDAVKGGMQCAAELDSSVVAGPAGSSTLQYLRNPDGVAVSQFADAAFWSSTIGPAGMLVTPPDQWVDLYTGSSGVNTQYPIARIDTTTNFINFPVTVKIAIDGRWTGTESVVVPAGTFECYVFKISVHATATATLQQIPVPVQLFDNTFVQTAWLARGVGMVRFLAPAQSVAVGVAGLGSQTFSQNGVLRELRGGTVVNAVRDNVAAPIAPRLSSGYPNPFGDRSIMNIDLPATTRGSLRLFDMTGRLVATVIDGPLAAGHTSAVIDASTLPAGMYVARLETPGSITTQRLCVVH